MKKDIIKLILLEKIHEIDIVTYIVELCYKLEEKETIEYHIKRYNKIKELYDASTERYMWGNVIIKSYVIDNKKYVIDVDPCPHFYNYTFLSYQVRDFVLDLIQQRGDIMDSEDKEDVNEADKHFSYISSNLKGKMICKFDNPINRYINKR